MVDIFALVLTHALLALVALRLVMRDDLDTDPELTERPQVDQRDA